MQGHYFCPKDNQTPSWLWHCLLASKENKHLLKVEKDSRRNLKIDSWPIGNHGLTHLHHAFPLAYPPRYRILSLFWPILWWTIGRLLWHAGLSTNLSSLDHRRVLLTNLLRTRASEDQWMVTPWCDEWLTTWCGLTLGRVLQVHVAAWFALVQVKSGCEKS
jgi:hypothetical protein